MTVRDALNSALDEEMSADPKVFLMGEEVRQNKHERFYFYVKLMCLSLWLTSNILMQVGEYQGAYKVRYVEEMRSNTCDFLMLYMFILYYLNNFLPLSPLK